MESNQPGILKNHEVYICEQYLKGRTQADIANELNVSLQSIQRKLTKYNIQSRPRGFQKGMKKFANGKDWGYQNKDRKLSKEHIRKSLRRNPKSSLEIKFEDIINKHNLPYMFVGNGEVLIGRKCPDFVNTNGQKIAVEVFYKRHKEQFKGGLFNWMDERSEIFHNYGWDIMFFDETQVTETDVLRRIG